MHPPLSPDQIELAAEVLATARNEVARIESLGALTPTDDASAEAIADALALRLGHSVVGWKIGCTSLAAQEFMGSPGAFAGRVFDDGTVQSGIVDAQAIIDPLLEGEFAFILGDDLAPSRTAYRLADVVSATVAVAPAIELVSSRFVDMTTVGYRSVIADSAVNAAVVVGEPVQVGDLPDLKDVRVTMQVDGTDVGGGTGADILDDPWQALLWLANHLSDRGLGLAAGQFVMSGTCTGIQPLPSAAMATATHEGIGSVSVTRRST